MLLIFKHFIYWVNIDAVSYSYICVQFNLTRGIELLFTSSFNLIATRWFKSVRKLIALFDRVLTFDVAG